MQQIGTPSPPPGPGWILVAGALGVGLVVAYGLAKRRKTCLCLGLFCGCVDPDRRG